MSFFPSLPNIPSSLEIFKADMDYFTPFVDFSRIIMRGESELDFGERELIGAYVSGLNDCTHLVGPHTATAANFGIEAKVFDQIMNNIDTADVPEKLKPVLKFVKKLALTPTQMVQADADAVFSAGWSEKALRDAICLTGVFSFMICLIEGYGVKAEPGELAQRMKKQGHHGYALNSKQD